MSLSSKTEVRRCRPLLGTFVEITASGLEDDDLQRAVNSAFSAIEHIHIILSAHDPDSELSLLNREAALHPVKVSRQTFALLRRAHKLAFESGGAFDHTVAPVLARWGLLPSALRRKKAGTWRDVSLLPGCQVQFLLPLALDLGGIAKGFAVDAAIRTLECHGVKSAVVNAGGDLRAAGAAPSVVYLRHPSSPQTFAWSIQLEQAALATSSPCFTERCWRGRRVSHLVNPFRQSAITGAVSVTVRARECWLADALTKVVLNAPRVAQRLLAKYDAEAFVLRA
jgi:thiamine biosynthesis lipoprotein